MSSKKTTNYRSAATEKITDNLRKNLPILDGRQVRRHRLEYAEALCFELEEDELPFSAEYIRSLLQYEEEHRELSEAQQIAWTHPLLKNQNHLLDKLYEGLRVAETASQEEKGNVKCDQFLQMAIYFSKLEKTWCWIARKLFEECIQTADCYADDGGERKAIVRYIYGIFLLEQKENLEEAKEQFTICRDMSAGKKWSAAQLLGVPQRSLFTESCSYLYRTLLMIAKHTMETDPLKAARICSLAKKRAIDAEDRQGEANSLMLLGLCEMKAGDANSAIARFNKVLNIYHSESNSTGICECRIQLALAHSRIGNLTEAYYHLQLMLEYADKHNLKYYYGQAHRFLGELKLKEEQPHIATPLLIKALTIFHELNDEENREQVRTLAAISAGTWTPRLTSRVAFNSLLIVGQELYPTFVKLVQSCPNRTECGNNFKKLLKWKETREAFWDVYEHTSIDREVFQKSGYERSSTRT